jgi:phosphonate transport system ATP-binding protein
MALIDLHLENAGYNGRNVLHDLTLSIKAGERIALIGASGAGKSTLLRLLYERCPAETALVPQDLGLVNALSVFHNVYMGRLHRNSTWHNLRNLVRPLKPELAAVRAILEKLRLEEDLFSTVGALSGGQQQRTAVGRALYQDSAVMLGDEPVSAVDEHQARQILESLNENSRTVVLAMHDRALALAHTSRVIGLRDGKVVMDQPTAGLKPADLDDLYTS